MSSLTPEKARVLRIHGTIAHELGVDIVSGRYRPGDLLEGEVEASERLKVSRTAYREAVRILAAKGLVEARPRVGTRVSPPERWHWLDPDVLSWLFEPEPDLDLLDRLFALRKVIEPEAAALAAANRSSVELDAMRQALASMARHNLSSEAGRKADQEFHAAVLSACRNPFIVSLTSGIGAAITWTTIFKHRHNLLPRNPFRDHEAVFEAIERSDVDGARTAMFKLIDLALKDITDARSAAG